MDLARPLLVVTFALVAVHAGPAGPAAPALAGTPSSLPSIFRRDARYFSVHVEQDGRRVRPRRGVHLLRRRPFDLVITFPGPDSVLVNSWTAPGSYNAARAGAPLARIAGFKQTGMAEGKHNQQRDLMLSPDSPQYLYYTSDADHRFNRVRRRGERVIAHRTVANLFLPSRRTTPLRRFGGRDLYLVLVKYLWSKDYSARDEKQRAALHLRFSD
jgi:hypothetical protein